MAPLPGILAIGTSTPPRKYSQREIYELISRYSPFYRSPRIEQIFMNSDIEERHMFFDSETIRPDETPDEMHERFRAGAMQIGSAAIRRCLEQGGFAATDIDFVVAVSCTGYLCPGLSALLIKELGMRTDLQRADLLGMGCAGAMPGLQRAYDFVKAYPGKKALVLAVEICSACYYIDDSLETVVGNAICGDGAASVIVGMTENPGHVKIEGFETLLEPSLIDKVGFEQRESKLRIILSKDIRDVAGSLGGKIIARLLQNHNMRHEDVDHWILHSGGRKVIDNVQKVCNLTDEQVAPSKEVLRHFGNMSSPTVLFVLDETVRASAPAPGDVGVMLAMGPGLAIEAALVRW
jgi:alkylresorcinol/alkylpyrone synthase/polyketide synthase Type III